MSSSGGARQGKAEGQCATFLRCRLVVIVMIIMRIVIMIMAIAIIRGKGY